MYNVVNMIAGAPGPIMKVSHFTMTILMLRFGNFESLICPINIRNSFLPNKHKVKKISKKFDFQK
jgi:hypothetical protein